MGMLVGVAGIQPGCLQLAFDPPADIPRGRAYSLCSHLKGPAAGTTSLLVCGIIHPTSGVGRRESFWCATSAILSYLLGVTEGELLWKNYYQGRHVSAAGLLGSARTSSVDKQC